MELREVSQLTNQQLNDLFTLSTQNWDSYRGMNHSRFPRPDMTCQGAVQFTKHIGKPLSQPLWEMLIHQLCISGLCVLRPSDCQWLCGRSQGFCYIHLDHNDLIEEITFWPHHPPYTKED